MEPWLRPMLCAPVDKVPDGPEWVIEGKLNGWRCVAHRGEDGTVQVFCGRNGSNYTDRLPYVQAQLEQLLPPDTAVDGELLGYATSAKSGDVGSIMASNSQVRGTPLQLALFDIIKHAGEDLRRLPWEDRRARLEQLDVAAAANIDVVPYAPASQDAHEALLKLGLEGSVCKLRSSVYVPFKSNAWVKCKPQQTDEARIVGFKPGKKGGQWDGKVGAFEVEMLDSGARTTVKCGTNARHQEATDHPERWKGVVIEIAHFGLGATGVPLSPQFLRRRDDRSPRKTTPNTNKEVRRMAPPVRRNYGAMGDGKLLKVIGELRNGGDAAQRAEAKGFAAAEDLSIAEGIAHSRGLRVPAA